MADESISGILTVPEAAQMGAQQATQGAQGFDLGQQLQQQIIRTQAMQSDLQQKQIENHAAMINNLAGRMSFLAGADDDDKKGPMWKMQFEGLSKDMNSYGVNMNPDDLKSALTDPTFSQKIRSTLQAVANSGLDPIKQAQVMQNAAYTLQRPDLIQNFPETAQKELESVAQTNFKMQGQDVQKQRLLQQMTDDVNKAREQFKTPMETASSIQNLLKPGQSYSTGMPQVVAMDELTKLATNTVVRQFTYSNLKGTINAPDQFLQQMTQKLESGEPLTQKQVSDIRLVAKTIQQGMEGQQDTLLRPLQQKASIMAKNPGWAGYEGELKSPFSAEEWNRYENMSNPQSQPTPSPKIKSLHVSKGPAPYQIGDPKRDPTFKGLIQKSKLTLAQINVLLAKSNTKMDQSTYNQLRDSK